MRTVIPTIVLQLDDLRIVKTDDTLVLEESSGVDAMGVRRWRLLIELIPATAFSRSITDRLVSIILFLLREGVTRCGLPLNR